MPIWLVISLFFLLLQNNALSQQKSQLDQLDSIAFDALEKSDPSVIEKANKLVQASGKNGISKYSVNGHTILGIVNKDKGYYLTSLNHYLKALDFSEKLNDLGRISACYNNIGSVYQLQENYTKACEYYNKSLSIENKLQNPLQKSIRYYNLGDAYSKMDSFDLALSYLTNSLIIEKKMNNSEGVIYAELGIADVYLKNKRSSDAIGLINKVGKKLKGYQVEERILFHILNGRYHLQKQDRSKALTLFNMAESISNENNFRIHLLDILKLQLEVHKFDSNWNLAVQTYDKYTALKDELNAIKIKNQLEDFSFQNELNKKDLEIQLINEEKELAIRNHQMEENISNHQQKIVWFLVVSLILLFSLIFIGIRKIAQKK